MSESGDGPGGDDGETGHVGERTDEEPTVRVRGIYATGLTELLRSEFTIVQASDPIHDRFEGEFPVRPAAVEVEPSHDNLGVGVIGGSETAMAVAEQLTAVSLDTLRWAAAAPRGAVYRGVVKETRGGGAIVYLGDGDGFLPYDRTEDYVDEGDIRRVQVAQPAPPWSDKRPLLETTLRIEGGLASLRRVSVDEAVGSTGDTRGDMAGLADLLSVDPPEGWTLEWTAAADDADIDALTDAVVQLGGQADGLMAAVANADDDHGQDPVRLYGGEATHWVWFGREGRFALDEYRGGVTTTMAGHHRIKAGSEDAGDAVDLVEAVCPETGDDHTRWDDVDFPFEAVADLFGPHVGDWVDLAHGKPNGRVIVLGRAEVTERSSDGSVTLRRDMSPGGTYDGLGVPRREGDIAITKVREGRWWYPTLYFSADGERRGTYVNICTPVEVFSDTVRYVDLHVDVVRHPDGRVTRLDDDELDAAIEAEYVPSVLAEKAREVAETIEEAL